MSQDRFSYGCMLCLQPFTITRVCPRRFFSHVTGVVVQSIFCRHPYRIGTSPSEAGTLQLWLVSLTCHRYRALRILLSWFSYRCMLPFTRRSVRKRSATLRTQPFTVPVLGHFRVALVDMARSGYAMSTRTSQWTPGLQI